MNLDFIDLEEETLKGIQFSVQQAIPKNTYPQNLRFEGWQEYSRNFFIRQLRWNLFGKEIKTKRYPSSWWEAFKNRWFPRFLKKHYPVKFDEFQLYNICPHIAFAWKDHSYMHLTWIREDHGFDVFHTEKED